MWDTAKCYVFGTYLKDFSLVNNLTFFQYTNKSLFYTFKPCYISC